MRNISRSIFMIAVTMALSFTAAATEAQSITIQQQPDTVLRFFATYRSASGAAQSTRDIVWLVASPGTVTIAGDARMRYVTVKPMREGFTWLRASATVSGQTFSDSIPVIVSPISRLGASVGLPAVVSADSLRTYAQGHFLPGQRQVLILQPGQVVQWCAALFGAGRIVSDSCTPGGGFQFQEAIDAWSASPRRFWVIAQR